MAYRHRSRAAGLQLPGLLAPGFLVVLLGLSFCIETAASRQSRQLLQGGTLPDIPSSPLLDINNTIANGTLPPIPNPFASPPSSPLTATPSPDASPLTATPSPDAPPVPAADPSPQPSSQPSPVSSPVPASPSPSPAPSPTASPVSKPSPSPSPLPSSPSPANTLQPSPSPRFSAPSPFMFPVQAPSPSNPGPSRNSGSSAQLSPPPNSSSKSNVGLIAGVAAGAAVAAIIIIGTIVYCMKQPSKNNSYAAAAGHNKYNDGSDWSADMEGHPLGGPGVGAGAGDWAGRQQVHGAAPMPGIKTAPTAAAAAAGWQQAAAIQNNRGLSSALPPSKMMPLGGMNMPVHMPPPQPAVVGYAHAADAPLVLHQEMAKLPPKLGVATAGTAAKSAGGFMMSSSMASSSNQTRIPGWAGDATTTQHAEADSMPLISDRALSANVTGNSITGTATATAVSTQPPSAVMVGNTQSYANMLSSAAAGMTGGGAAERSNKSVENTSVSQPASQPGSAQVTGVSTVGMLPAGPNWLQHAPPRVVPGEDEGKSSTKTRTLEALKIRWSDIAIGGVLGEGGFGKVYKGTWEGNRVAVKMVSTDHVDEAVLMSLHQEALVMNELIRHPAIARVFGVVDEPPNHALVMQYYRRGTLAKFLHSITFMEMPLTSRLRMALQVATGMRYMHDRKPPILHGDLKSSNILLEDDLRCVIADLGLATLVGQDQVHSGALTVSIAPPEVLANPRAPRTSRAMDVYSFGIVMWEVVTGQQAYRGMRANDIKQIVMGGRRPGIPDTLPESVSSLVQECWSQDPTQRPQFAEVADRLAIIIQELDGAVGGFETTHHTTTNFY